MNEEAGEMTDSGLSFYHCFECNSYDNVMYTVQCGHTSAPSAVNVSNIQQISGLLVYHKNNVHHHQHLHQS